ncbi:hypothetical protein GMOD_00001640 [Pyrenophora seminiperda CCB06]|uniref:Uncharacterized protein n=1 Tax=Pyrenophora seminiperda CCB06 TaxID=1302712 RepID=A0A3M7LZU6_9PLEO|nr:hypothetical protein GMOD_00001640 [Pyrenophora seminiperda CCB06]
MRHEEQTGGVQESSLHFGCLRHEVGSGGWHGCVEARPSSSIYNYSTSVTAVGNPISESQTPIPEAPAQHPVDLTPVYSCRTKSPCLKIRNMDRESTAASASGVLR